MVSLICSVIFSIGNLMYANISLVPNNIGIITDARVWYMLVVRFIVGVGTGKVPKLLSILKMKLIHAGITKTA